MCLAVPFMLLACCVTRSHSRPPFPSGPGPDQSLASPADSMIAGRGFRHSAPPTAAQAPRGSELEVRLRPHQSPTHPTNHPLEPDLEVDSQMSSSPVRVRQAPYLTRTTKQVQQVLDRRLSFTRSLPDEMQCLQCFTDRPVMPATLNPPSPNRLLLTGYPLLRVQR
ncbi:hypothetical protein B0T22DRAFT_68079 [Podospora appendiculata]|uniref:Uncharacterized protein n=1 Tax=Podospora appendiculata TaxID=314037 RepID=A0AAE1CHA1_9PEZI|nr:hypothetical protein B0T22DRAFT_68079 [Podospora appendiculata]